MMQLAYPAALLALVAIPLILLLHLLRPRRRRVLLASTALWRAAAAERESARGLRRLLRNLSLLLLLLAAAALGLALAGPQWITPAAEAIDTVLVIDASASMKTRAGATGTRFDLAIAEAHAIVSGMPLEGRALVMTSGRRPLIRSGFESDRGALKHVLAGLRASDEAGRPREALGLALSLLRGREHGRVYFITDGAFDPDLAPVSPRLLVRVVGGPARNVAITRFDLRQERSGEERFQLLVSVHNYTDAPVAVPASVRLDGRTLFERTLALPARGAETLVVPVAGRALGQALARIEADDDLRTDNQAYAAVNALPALRALLVSRGNFHLESALEALPEVALDKRAELPAEELARLAGAYDVVILDGIAAPRLAPGNYLLVNALPPGLPISERGRVAQPRISGRGESALVRDLELGAVRIAEARRIAIDRPANVQRLFWSPETDLALALLEDGVRAVYVGFDVARSSFPLQAAFPLFMSQSLEWLRPRGGGHETTHIAAGSTRHIALPSTQNELVVETPSGSAHTLKAQHGVARFEATGEAGIYRYRLGESVQHFAVNLADQAESDVAQRWVARERRDGADIAGPELEAALPLWPYLLSIALVALALEWCVWAGSRGRA